MKSMFSPLRSLVLPFALGLVSFASSAAAEDGPQVLLKTTWKPNKTYTLDQKLVQDMTTGAMGTTKSDISFQYGIKSMPAAGSEELKLAMNFQKMTVDVKMNMMGKDIHINSDDENDPQAKTMRQSFEPMLKAELVAVLDKDGVLKEINGLESMANPMLKQFVSKDAFSQMITQDKFFAFPKQAVGAGAKWKIDESINYASMKMQFKGEGSVEKIEKSNGHDMADIRIKGNMTMDMEALGKMITEAAAAKGGDKAGPPPDMMPKVKDMKMDFTMQFDATEGMTISTVGNTDIEMSMKMPKPGSEAAGEKEEIKMTIKQKLDSHTKIEETK